MLLDLADWGIIFFICLLYLHIYIYIGVGSAVAEGVTTRVCCIERGLKEGLGLHVYGSPDYVGVIITHVRAAFAHTSTLPAHSYKPFPYISTVISVFLLDVFCFVPAVSFCGVSHLHTFPHAGFPTSAHFRCPPLMFRLIVWVHANMVFQVRHDVAM